MGVARATLRFDARTGWRSLRRRPLFLCSTVLVLGLGIGANAAVTGLGWAVLGAPLPFDEADRLVRIFHADDLSFGVALSELRRYRERARTLDDVAGWTVGGVTLDEAEGVLRVVRSRVTPNLFDLLRRPPAIGTGFEPDGSGAGVVLSHRFWRQRYGGDPGMLGRVLRLDGERHPVVGVLPGDVVFPDPSVDLYVALDLSSPPEPGRSGPFLDAVARLAEGADLAAARNEVAVLADGMRAADPAAYEAEPGFGGHLVPFREARVRGDRPLLIALGAAALLLLLATCFNVATLLLGRAEERRTEIAVRRALGADGLAIVRLRLTEATLLAGLGALAAVFVAVFLGRALAAGVVESLSVSGRDPSSVVMLATPVVAVVAALLVALLTLARSPAPASIGAPSRTHSGGEGPTRRILPPVQIALAVILCSSSVLMYQTVRELVTRPLGYAVEGVLAARIDLPEERYSSSEATLALIDGIRERLEAAPRIAGVGAVNALPLSDYGGSGDVVVESVDPDAAVAVVTQRIAGREYFPAAGIELVAGRSFDARDRPGSSRVALVDEAFARRFFGDPRDALGERIRFFFGGADWNEIVGVVGHVRHAGPAGDAGPQVYVPLAQRPTGGLHLVVRFDGDVAPVAGALRAAVRGLDPRIPVYDMASMQERLGASIRRERFALTVFAAFGLLAVVLAGAGTYAVLALSQRRRVREIGIRRALGAPSAAIVGSVLRTGGGLLVAGCVAGAVGSVAMALLLSRLIETLAGGTLVPISVAIGILALTAGAATLSPTLRALRVDPKRIMGAE